MKKLFTISLLLFACIQISAQNNFTALTNPTGGTVVAFQFEGTKVYAIEQINRQIFVTENDGTSWTRVGVGKIIEPHAFFIESNTKWYYADYGNFYTSNDAGNTWTRTGSGIRNGRKLFKLPKVGAISDVDVFVLETDCEGVFVSSNAGATWKLITDNNGCVGYSYQVAIDGNGNIYYTDYEKGIRRHPVPTDDTWDKSKVTTVYTKETAGVDFNLSVGVNRVSNKVYIEHSNAAGTVLRKTSVSGNASSFVALGNGTQSLPTNSAGVWSCTPAGIMYLATGSSMFELTNETTPVWTLRTKANDSRADYNIRTVDWKSNTEAYAGADWSGIFRTTNNAAAWTVVNGTTTSNGILSYVGSDIEITANGNIVLKDDNGTRGVWVSTNQTSFNYVSANPPAFFYGARWQNKLFQIGTNTLFVQSSTGTHRSTDGGLTWTNVSGSGYFIYLSPSAGEIIGMGSTFGRSTNNGANWSNITVAGLPASYTLMYAFKSEGTNNYFVSLVNNTNNQTEYWRLDGSAATWTATKLITPLSTNGFSCTGFFEINGKIYAADGERFAFSTNQGVSWTSLNYFHQHMLPIRQGTGGIGLGSAGNLAITQDDGINWRNFGFPSQHPNFTPRDIAFDAGNNAYLTGSGGPVMKFTGNLIVPANELPPVINFGWQNLNGPFTGQLNKIFRDGSGQLYTGHSGAIFKYNAAQTRWDRITIPGLLFNIQDWTVDNNGRIYVINFNSLFVSTNGGSTWTTANTSLNSPFKVIGANNGNIILGTSSGVLLSTNGGTTFNSVATFNSGSVYNLGISTTGVLYAARFESTNQLMRSADNGATWAASGSGQIDITASKEILSISTLNSGAVAITTTDNVYRTTNGGTTWTSVRGNLPTNTSFGFTAIYNDSFFRYYTKLYQAPNGDLYFNNNRAFFISTDNGTSWTKQSDLTTVGISEAVWNTTTIIASTTGDGVYQSTNNGTSFTRFSNNTGIVPSLYNSLVVSNGRILTTASGGRFYSSADGLNFAEVGNANLYVDYVTKLPNGTLAAHGGGITLSTDNGLTWTNQNAANGYYQRLSTADNNVFFAIRDLNGTNQLVRSTNLKDWTVINISNFLPNGTYNISSLANTPDEKIFLTVFNFSNGKYELYVISFGTAQLVGTINNASNVVYKNGKIYTYATFGNIYETTDGISWISRSAPSGNNTLRITENNYFFIENFGIGTLWISRDQGASWQNISGFGNDPVQAVEVDLTTGFAFAAVGNRPIQKSSAIIIPNDNTNPIVSERVPAQSANNVPVNFVITLTFNETVKAVSGKQIKLINPATPLNPLQTWSATSAVFSNGNKTVSFTPTVSISNLANFSVIVDQGAFTDIFGNQFAGYPNTADWTFRTIDNIPPVITFTPADLQEGVALIFSASVSDNESVSPSATKIWYRKIGQPTANFTAAEFVNQSAGNNLTARNFTLNVNPSWYDAMGIEFYIEAEDGTGNKGRLPVETDKFFYSYTKYTTDANSPLRPKLTGLTSGSTVASYRIIAIPFIVTDNKVSTIFNELGEPNRDNWRLLTYNGTSYDNLPDQISVIERGKGYWFLQRSFTDIFVENASSPNNNRANPFKLNLKSGWNQIGNPYTLPISWDAIRAGIPELGTLKKFNNGYSNATTLNAFEGGFVFLTGNARTIDIPVTAIGSTANRVKETSSDLAATHWEVPLLVTQGDITNGIGGIGMHNNATDDVDAYDDYNPPSVFDKLEVNFSVTNKMLAKNVVGKREFYQWNFTAHAEGNQPATLRWNPTTFGNNDYQLWLFDHATQQIADMRTHTEYNLLSKANSLTIYYGQNLETKVKPSASMLGNAYPNPASTTVTVPFTVANEADGACVTLSLYDTKGNAVHHLLSKQTESGFYQEKFDLPANLPTGLYLIRYTEVKNGMKGKQQHKKIVIQ
ncbi:MAG: T9SS type A sorting domain-containing protein [Chryseotalea sp.]